jgi:hypothetical protein
MNDFPSKTLAGELIEQSERESAVMPVDPILNTEIFHSEWFQLCRR